MVRTHLFLLQVEPLGRRCKTVSNRKLGRRILFGSFLHIQRTMQGLLRSNLIVGTTGGKEFHLTLSPVIFAGVGKPAADHLSIGNSIRLNSQLISNLKAYRQPLGCMRRTQRINHLRQMLLVYQFGSRQGTALFGLFHLFRLRINAEQIGCSLIKVTLLPVHIHHLKCLGLFPGIQHTVGHQRIVILYIRHYALLVFSEIQRDTPVPFRFRNAYGIRNNLRNHLLLLAGRYTQ